MGFLAMSLREELRIYEMIVHYKTSYVGGQLHNKQAFFRYFPMNFDHCVLTLLITCICMQAIGLYYIQLLPRDESVTEAPTLFWM